MKAKNITDFTTQYAESVVSGQQAACRYVRLACERHLRDLDRADVWFDPEAARHFFRYCERYLKHYKGPSRGTPLKLEPWQKFIFGCIYGWKQVVDSEETDLWRFNIVYIEVPRKNGKTTIAAAGASYDCSLVEDTGAEVYCLATKEDQAKLLYNDVAAYIAGSPELDSSFEILKGKNTIFANGSSRTSFIKPLGSDSQRLDGLNPMAAYADELHAWPNRDLWDVMEDAFGARDHWHMIAITTAGNNREGICYQQRDHLINILEGRIQDDHKFGVIYTVDEEKREDWNKPENWFIANPNLGTGKLVDYMEKKCLGAVQMPSSLNAFLNKQLNVWTDVAEAWLSVEKWNACGRTVTLESLKHKRCCAAFDLARVNDLSAVAYVFNRQPGLEHITVWVDFYLPEAELRDKSVRDRVDYRLWQKQGFITITPGKTTDYEFIRKQVNDRAAWFRLETVLYDRHFSGELVTNLTNDGLSLKEVGMGFVSLGNPTAELERLIVENSFIHPNQPILNWNAANVVVRRDPAGNIKPDKDASNKRIDGVVAIIMALSEVVINKPKTSKYETEGVLSFGGKRRT